MLPTVIGLCAALVWTGGLQGVAAPTVPSTYSLWSLSTIPKVPADADPARVEVGTRFVPGVDGRVTHIRFYGSPTNLGPHVGTLWTGSGQVLATVDFDPRSGAGWHSAELDEPVDLDAGQTYVVSYVAPHGHYAGDADVFTNGKTVSAGPLTALEGVYSYEARFPTNTWRGSSYYVDVVFEPAATETPSVEPTPTPVPTTPAPPSPTATPTVRPTVTPTTSPSPTAAPTQPGSRPTNCAALPSACGYPDDTNTGVPAGATLRRSGSVTASEDGQIISGLDITGEINVTAPNVVIKNSRITGGRGAGSENWVIIIRPGAENLTIQDTEITTPAGSEQDSACVFNIGDTSPTLLRVDIHGCSQGVSTGGGVIRDSYIHDMGQIPGLSHVDGIASNGGGGLTVQHNTVFNQFNQTAAVALFQDFGTQQDNLVENNLVAGGGYTFYGGAGRFGPTSKIRFVNNRVSTRYFPRGGYFGVVAWFSASDSGNQFAGNYWDHDLKPVSP